MQKKILIVSDGYHKPLYGPRMTQLCKYLSRWGWDVTVVTEKIGNDPYTIPDVRFLAMPYYEGPPLQQKWRWFIDKVSHAKERMLYQYAVRQIRDFSSFSLVLCSTFNLFPLLTAQRIATENSLPLFVDLRDITEQWGESNYFAHDLRLPHAIKRSLIKIFERDTIRRRNRILRQATAVTTISPWHREILQAIAPCTHLIYNGFDPEVYKPSDEPSSQCIISYCGRFYDFQSRNPLYFFNAIAELHQEHLIAPDSLRIIFHIEEYFVAHIQQWVSDLGIQDYFDVSGYIPHHQAVRLLLQSSVSLLFVAEPSANTPKGVMTTKFYEALGCEKPVLCVPSDESVLAATIRNTNAGLASSDVKEIKAFILEKYHEWLQNGYTHQQVKDKEQFSREYQARQFEDLFLQCQ